MREVAVADDGTSLARFRAWWRRRREGLPNWWT
jgi:hypothetical protein